MAEYVTKHTAKPMIIATTYMCVPHRHDLALLRLHRLNSLVNFEGDDGECYPRAKEVDPENILIKTSFCIEIENESIDGNKQSYKIDEASFKNLSNIS